jgi:peptidoglycan/xylan/chitin deacetylase (PgdA/CDA1 family)
MSLQQPGGPNRPPQRRRPPQTPAPRRTTPAARVVALLALIAAFGTFAAIVLGTGGGSGKKTTTHISQTARTSTTGTSSAAAKGGTQAIPILGYNVINSQPPGSTAPASLYVPADEFSAQMQALKAAGWHAVTLDQVIAYWTHGTSLGSGKPIVITFDGGYASQYANALPVLKQLGWPAIENLPSTLLPSSEGGISDSQVKSLVAAGWKLGVQGSAHPDLTTFSAAQVNSELTTERQAVSSRYGASVNWFSYPGGHYNPTVTAGVRATGFSGALTSVSGWASPKGDRYLLPRLEVVGGTAPSQLISQITAAQSQSTPPPSQ